MVLVCHLLAVAHIVDHTGMEHRASSPLGDLPRPPAPTAQLPSTRGSQRRGHDRVASTADGGEVAYYGGRQ